MEFFNCISENYLYIYIYVYIYIECLVKSIRNNIFYNYICEKTIFLLENIILLLCISFYQVCFNSEIFL